MAKYDGTKFYWLQLKEDFFDEDAIDWLEEQPNGKEYSLFYLKLCLKSLRTNGILIRKVGNMLIPYDHVKLGELTNTNPDTVMIAMNLLMKIGLVKKLENGELYLTQVEDMIGSQSKGAFKKQQQRIANKNNLLLGSGQEGDKCPPEIEIEIELEKDIDINKDKKKNIKSLDDVLEEKVNDISLKETLNEFIKMRKTIKKPLTTRALEMVINKINKLTSNIEEQKQILEQSIINCWQDVYPLKNYSLNNNGGKSEGEEYERYYKHNS